MKGVLFMPNPLNAALGILIPFLGTSSGAAAVFFLRREMHPRPQKALMGFAAGVMLAASVWSLLLPAIEMARAAGRPAWLTAAGGFLLGSAGMLVLGRFAPETDGALRGKSMRLSLAVTLHNGPEGMAVGVALAGMLSGTAGIAAAEALALCVGVAVQNIPEGAIVSMPLSAAGCGRGKAFFYGVLSGAVEPVAAVVTLLLTRLLAPALPVVLAFAAGAMIWVTVDDLLPEARSRAGTLGTTLGFALMMLLDVALG